MTFLFPPGIKGLKFMPSSPRSLTGVSILLGVSTILEEGNVKDFIDFVIVSFFIIVKEFYPFDSLCFMKP